MNKKLSLMMAAILAAGYSVTAEAGVYKVTGSATANNFYVIADNNYNAEASYALRANSLGSGMEAVQKVDFSDEAALWKVSAATAGEITNKKYPLYGITTAGAWGTSFDVFTAAAPLTGSASSFTLKLGNGSISLASTTNDATDAYLYVVGTPILAEGTNQYLNINDKYLVATAAGTGVLVDAALLPLYDSKAYLWDVDAKGIAKNGKGLYITTIGSSYDVTVSATPGEAKAIEKDANNEASTSVYVDGTGVISSIKQANITGSTTAPTATIHENTDAVAFVTGKAYYLGVYASDDKYIQNDGTVGGTSKPTGHSFTAEATKVKDVYSFRKADGNLLVMGGIAEFKVVFLNEAKTVFSLLKADGSQALTVAAALGDLDAAAQFCLVKGTPKDITGTELAKLEKDGFSMTLKYQDDKGNWMTSLKGNPFVGHLTVTGVSGNKFQLKSGDNYIVAEKGLLEDGTMTDVYKFKTVTAKALNDDKAGDQKYVYEFSATKSDIEETPTEIVLKLEAASPTEIGYYNVLTDVYVGAGVDPKTLTFAIGSGTAVKPSELLVKDKFFTIVKIDKKEGNSVLAVKLADDNTPASAYGVAAFMKDYNNELEAQWALTVKEDGLNYLLTNRESKGVTKEIAISSLYHAEGDNTYSVGSDETWIIAPVEKTDAADGYVRLSNVKNTRYNLGYWSDTFKGTAWFTENHKDVKKDQHVIGLDQDNDALEFAAVDFTGAKNVEKNTVSDSIYVVSTLGYYKANGEYDTTLDTLKVVAYSFINQYNEPLKLGKDVENQDAYVSNAKPQYETLSEAIEAVKAANSTVAQKFTLRKDGDKLNLRPVTFAQASGQLYREFSMVNDYNKMYSGDTKNGILNNTEMYGRAENDLFVVEPTEKPMYRTVVNNLDTIAIYRNDNDKSILFEKGEFLGMENLAQYPAIAPAMVADLAHVDKDGYHPQYMLMVEPEFVVGGKWCPEHGFNSGCPHEVKVPDYTKGRYLVSLKDTAVAWEANKVHGKVNPYINTENNYKLGFVPASHLADTLIIASDSNKIQLNNENYNVAKFSFRYVDNEEKSFVIETADYKRIPEGDDAGKFDEDKMGYLKWMNGVVVVVNNIKDADVYNMTEGYEGNPTANEGINASSVSVIAGNGVITINGAAGKKVVISNVLGQTIANAVLSSDNATISAPQGVVVVAVEGEAAVKTIVK